MGIPDVWSQNPVNTSIGPTILTSYTGTQTITATIGTIPEPTSFFPAAVGLTAMWLIRVEKRKSTIPSVTVFPGASDKPAVSRSTSVGRALRSDVTGAAILSK